MSCPLHSKVANVSSIVCIRGEGEWGRVGSSGESGESVYNVSAWIREGGAHDV